TLLRSYSLLPEPTRERLPLMISCDLSDATEAWIREQAEQFGISDDVVLTRFVSNEELVALYNAATMVVHASRYEGFGLPVLEAMQCGAPVVTTTSPALAEVAGDAALLVDPDDAAGFAGALSRLLEDRALRGDLGRKGIERARAFTPTA